jgi:hypothetical protein
VLQKTFDQQRENFAADAEAAEKLLKVGESKVPADLDKVQLAAMTATANVLLNLNETISK